MDLKGDKGCYEHITTTMRKNDHEETKDITITDLVLEMRKAFADTDRRSVEFTQLVESIARNPADVQKDTKETSVHRYQHAFARIGVYLVLHGEADHIILLRRSNTGFADGMLGLPSGNVEWGETLPQAACREAFEECGIRIRENDLSLIHVHLRFKRPDDERLDFFFHCRRWSGRLRNCEPHKHSSISPFYLNALPTDMIPYHRQAVEISQRVGFSQISISAEPRPT